MRNRSGSLNHHLGGFSLNSGENFLRFLVTRSRSLHHRDHEVESPRMGHNFRN
jgi:hypothetical protein